MKMYKPTLVGLSLLALTACGNESESESSNETNSGSVSGDEVLSTSDVGDVTTQDILDQIGINTIGNHTFQLTLDNIVKDKYEGEVDEDAVTSQIDEEIESMGGTEQFEAMIQQQSPGMTVDKYKEQAITNAYHDAFFADILNITDESVQENSAAASHILIPVDEESEEDSEGLSDSEAKEKAEDIISQLNDGAEFSELAKENSQDPGSAQNGGSLGLVTKGQMVEPFEEALFELEAGEITSEPVKSEFGYHIIKREEEASESDLEAAKSQLVNERIQSDRDAVLNSYQELLDEYNVEFTNEEINNYINESFLRSTESESTEDASDETTEQTEENSEESTENTEDTEENEENADSE